MAFDQGHALVIGVGTYQDQALKDVPLTEQDAAQVAAVLQDPALCGYPAAQVQLLTGAAATRPAVLAGLDRLTDPNIVTPDDTVVVFYSGHGEQGANAPDGTPGPYNLTTTETQIVDNKVVHETGIGEHELLAKIKAIPANRVLLIFNACYSGAVVGPGVLGADDPGTLGPDEQPAVGALSLPEATANALLATGQGRVVVTACSPEQRSYFAWNEQTTLFGRTFVAGLKGDGLSSSNGYISVFQLYEALYGRVSEEALTRWNKTQEPELTIQRGRGVMAVALFQGQGAPGVLGLDDNAEARPAVLPGRTREVAEEDSADALRRIAPGLVVSSGPVSGDVNAIGNQSNFAAAQGNVIGASGPVSVDNSRNQQRDSFTFSGDFTGGILNVASNLTDVQQTINAAPAAPQAKSELLRLTELLDASLNRAPSGETERVNKIRKAIKNLVDQLKNPSLDSDELEFNFNRLSGETAALQAAVPELPGIAAQLAQQIRTLLG